MYRGLGVCILTICSYTHVKRRAHALTQIRTKQMDSESEDETPQPSLRAAASHKPSSSRANVGKVSAPAAPCAHATGKTHDKPAPEGQHVAQTHGRSAAASSCVNGSGDGGSGERRGGNSGKALSLSSGKAAAVGDEDGDGSWRGGHTEVRKEAFKRVAVIETDSDSDSDSGANGKQAGGDVKRHVSSSSSAKNGGFKRVPISEADSDSDTDKSEGDARGEAANKTPDCITTADAHARQPEKGLDSQILSRNMGSDGGSTACQRQETRRSNGGCDAAVRGYSSGGSDDLVVCGQGLPDDEV